MNNADKPIVDQNLRPANQGQGAENMWLNLQRNAEFLRRSAEFLDPSSLDAGRQATYLHHGIGAKGNCTYASQR